MHIILHKGPSAINEVSRDDPMRHPPRESQPASYAARRNLESVGRDNHEFLSGANIFSIAPYSFVYIIRHMAKCGR
jgi:hypothetical protein